MVKSRFLKGFLLFQMLQSKQTVTQVATLVTSTAQEGVRVDS